MGCTPSATSGTSPDTGTVEKVWAAAEDSPGYPYIHFIAKSDLEEEDPATV